MNFWSYLNTRALRRHELAKIRAGRKPVRIDARGWIGLGVYLLTVGVLAMMVLFPSLRGDEFFKTIATLIVGAYIKDVVSWAYNSTKGGGELAERNAKLVEDQARINSPLGEKG